MRKSGRYDTSELVEAQFEPGSRGRILRNLLGIKNKREMDRYEAVALQQAEPALFQRYGRNHRFSEKDARNIHRIWLGRIYEWAGEYRTVDLTKNSFRFTHARFISEQMEEFEKNFLQQYTPCIFKANDRTVQALANVHAKKEYIAAVHAGVGKDYGPMEKIFTWVLEKTIPRTRRA